MIYDQSIDTIYDGLFLMTATYQSEQGAYNGDGIWVNNPINQTINCNIQPISNKDIQNLPDGIKPQDCKKLYTDTPMDDKRSHFIIYENRQYLIYNVENWGSYNYYKALLIFKE